MSNNTPSTEIAAFNPTAQDASSIIASLRSDSGSVFSTFVGDDFETKVSIFDAVTNAEDVADHLGETILLSNVVAQSITINDDETGNPIDVVRLVLVAEDGAAYGAISGGIARSLSTLFGILGQPNTWATSLPVKVVQEGTGTRKYFTIKTVGSGASKPAAKPTK